MLSSRRVHATLPSPDPEALKTFYEEKLGLVPFAERPGAIVYRVGEGSFFLISRSGLRPGGHTQMAFTVPDIEAEVRELRERGVVFEEYEAPRTEDGIATMPAGRAAWIKDPDGNLIGPFQFDEPVWMGKPRGASRRVGVGSRRVGGSDSRRVGGSGSRRVGGSGSRRVRWQRVAAGPVPLDQVGGPGT